MICKKINLIVSYKINCLNKNNKFIKHKYSLIDFLELNKITKKLLKIK